MARHDARAVRGQYGDASLWRSSCGCGWRAEARSKQDAERLAKVHSWAVPAERRIVNALAIVERLACSCGFDYDSAAMEWAAVQKPCPKHALLAEFGIVEGRAS